LPARDTAAHKGDFGHVLVVGGSLGMAGAPALAGMAALRSGAGLATVACPAEIAAVVAGFEPCYMTLPMSRWSIDDLLDHQATVVVLGPGLGPNAGDYATEATARLKQPLVLDADGLRFGTTDADRLKRRTAPTVVTPHPGEFARMIGRSTAEVQARRVELAVAYANSHGCVVALKGAETVVTDGKRWAKNATGNPGMATGGSGDVLAGVVGALLAQGMSAWEAARLGVHVHGLAGDLAAAELSPVGMIAGDLLRFLPAAWKSLADER
jgi:NAD(P)H-hydrate epimerase